MVNETVDEKAEMTRSDHSIRFLVLVALGVFGVLYWVGCSTTELEPAPPPNPPAYTRVPHPEGDAHGDIAAIFLDKAAPNAAVYAVICDADFRKLVKATRSTDELNQGIRELVRSDPVKYHWCFYAQLLQIEDTVKSEAYLDERQTKVLNVFQFLVQVARAFATEFQDSRYLRHAVHRYQKISELVFFRRLELTRQGTLELVQPSNPFGLWHKSEGGFSVLEKYGISSQPAPVSAALPEPASVPEAVSRPEAAAASKAPFTGANIPFAEESLPAPEVGTSATGTEATGGERTAGSDSTQTRTPAQVSPPAQASPMDDALAAP